MLFLLCGLATVALHIAWHLPLFMELPWSGMSFPLASRRMSRRIGWVGPGWDAGGWAVLTAEATCVTFRLRRWNLRCRGWLAWWWFFYMNHEVLLLKVCFFSCFFFLITLLQVSFVFLFGFLLRSFAHSLLFLTIVPFFFSVWFIFMLAFFHIRRATGMHVWDAPADAPDATFDTTDHHGR